MTHTPGPWFAKFDKHGGYDCMTDAWDVATAGSRFTVAKLDLCNYGQTAREDATNAGKALAAADARLIAAAPDLLAALKRIEFGANGYCPECDGWNASPSGSTRNAHANGCALAAAIAKAEGR